MHEAFVPQMMSATVFVFPPVHVAGPDSFAIPQSLSVTRTIAFAAIDISLLKSMMILSPPSSVLAKPPEALSDAKVEIGAFTSGVPGILTPA